MYTRSPLVAIVGPNEAGKTSLLEALEHLSRDTGFSAREFSGRRAPGERDGDENPIIINARFELDDEDRAAVPGLDKDTAYTFEYRKRANGERRRMLDPSLTRDLRPRQRAAKALWEALTKPWETTLEDDEADQMMAGLKQLATELDTHDATLRVAVIDALNERAPEVRETAAEGTRKAVAEVLPALLETTARHELEQHPNSRACDALVARVPKFLLFDDDARQLDSVYSWAEYSDGPDGLANLLDLAGLDFASYKSIATDPERRAELATLERNANATLKTQFEAWRQSELTVELKADEQQLELLVFDHRTAEHTRFEERSAGLRTFVALVAFVARYSGGRRPVLLIDEAETHLHYGAQADLIRVFERQTVAHKVIFTTHSIGCLPEDLGTTIRVVAPATTDERSRIRNEFWLAGVGMTPMMLAMGANALAFTPSRFAVIGEGATEAILLPSMLREVRAAKYRGEPLGFQVVPGISEVSEEDADDLEFEAGNVAYLIDDDKGGRAHAAKLPARAHREKRVVKLGGGKIEGICIEDCIDAAVLASAFNYVLDHNAMVSTQPRVQPAELPEVGRAAWLDKWCEDHGEQRQSKTHVAQAALQQLDGRRRLVERNRRTSLRNTYEHLLKAVTRQEPKT